MTAEEAGFTVTAKRQRTPVVHTEEFFTEPRPWGAAQPAAATGR